MINFLNILRLTKGKKSPQISSSHLLASLRIMVPHQMLHPQPTRQKRIVKSWAKATKLWTIKEPSRPTGVSFTWNLGFPKHRQNSPLMKVPGKSNQSFINKTFTPRIFLIKYFPPITIPTFTRQEAYRSRSNLQGVVKIAGTLNYSHVGFVRMA